MVVVAFSSLAKIWGECSTIYSTPALFLWKWRLARAHLFHSLCQDQSTVAQRSETTVAESSLTSWVWARFRIGSHIMPRQGHRQPLQLQWVKGVRVFRCNMPPVPLVEWSGSFTCHCDNMGLEQTPNKSHRTKLTLEKKILSPLLSGFELATFRSWARLSYQQSLPALFGISRSRRFR